MSEETNIPLPRSLQDIVGALLFASETPLTAGDLREAVRHVGIEEGENREVMEVYQTATGREVDAALKGLAKALDVAGCGIELVCTGGAYKLQTSPSCGRYVRSLLKLDRPSRLGRASLETLAIIAYRQPITKSEVEEIRGVDVSGNIKTLMDLQLVRLVGKSELPGHPFLYGTTPLFLEHFGLVSLQQLNELDPTLQRSNPREKLALYKKPVKQEELELAAAAQAAAEEAALEEAAQEAESALEGQEEEEEFAPAGKREDENAGQQGDLFIADLSGDEEEDEGEFDEEDEEDEFDDEEDEFDDEEDEFDDEDEEEDEEEEDEEGDEDDEE